MGGCVDLNISAADFGELGVSKYPSTPRQKSWELVVWADKREWSWRRFWTPTRGRAEASAQLRNRQRRNTPVTGKLGLSAGEMTSMNDEPQTRLAERADFG